MDPASKYTELQAETSSTFEKIGKFLADLCEGSEAHENVSGDFGLDSSIGSFFETFSNLKARHGDQNLTVAVLALTKSGKSTLLNALIGANCLPANNVPETARITRITHSPGQAELVDNTEDQPKIVTGEVDIKAYLRYLNSETRTRNHVLSDETYLDLKIPIAALQGSDEATAAAQTVTIRLLDTPGPNEAGEVALKAQVERLLDSVDAVIYLLDYTKLKTSDEAEVLQRLQEINPQLIARLSQRLFFVVNKADMIETSEGMDADDTKQYVADLITGQMQDKRFELKPDQVLLLSAQQALLSRLVLQGKADKDINMRFGRLAFGSRAWRCSAHEHKRAAEEMLTDSGLAELEETVLAFLYAHSGSLKLLALLDDTVHMLSQIKNVTAASSAALQHDVASLQQETQEMQNKVERSLQSFETVQHEAQAVEGEVVDEVQQRMQRLKEKLFRDVTGVLEPSRLPSPGRWQEAWHRAARFLNRRPGHTEAHQLELQNKLYELHAAISSSIEAEVRDFWQDVEAASNERQRSMFQCINRRLEILSREIEATVGEALDLRLEPVTIAMDPPAAQDFHDSLQNLFQQGIRQRSVTRHRHRQQAYTVWEPRFRNGLCRTGQYFVGRPASRHVAEQYEQSVYDLQPHHIKEYFIALVDGTVEASVKYVREYVHAYLSDMLEDARSQIQKYGQSYNTTMLAALKTRQQGEEARNAAVAMTSARLSSTNKLLRDVAAIQRHAEDLCPKQHSISDVMSEFSMDEPETSHATPAPNVAQVGEAESCHAVHAEPAATEVKGVGSSSMPDWACFGSMSTTAAQSGLIPGSGSPIPAAQIPDFGSLLAHTSSQTSAVGVAAALEAGAAAAEAGQRDAEGSVSAAGDGDFPVPAVQVRGSAVGPQESPLPAMMSELQEAMSASVSSTGSSVVEGLPLDEKCELELALFLSLEDKDNSDRQAAAAAVTDAASAATDAAAAATKAASAAATKAASAASAAAVQAGTAAAAAAAQVGAATPHACVNVAVASAHSTVDAVRRQLDATLTSLLGFNRMAAQGNAHSSNSIQQEEAEFAQSASSDLSSNSVGRSVPAASECLQENFHGRYDALSKTAAAAAQAQQPSTGSFSSSCSDTNRQLDPVATAVAAAAFPRMHSFSSDNSSFDFTEAPTAPNLMEMPVAASSQFAALSLLHADNATPGPSHPQAEVQASVSCLDSLDSGIEYLPEEEADSPFFVGGDSPFVGNGPAAEAATAVAAGSNHVSGAEDVAADDALVPVASWGSVPVYTGPISGDQNLPFLYPQVNRSNLSCEGPSSPIHYPRVEHPTTHPAGQDSSTARAATNPFATQFNAAKAVTHPSEPATPRTQLHTAALGTDVFNGHSFMTGNEDPELEGTVSWSEPAIESDAVGPASIHVHQEHEDHLANNRLAALSGHGELSQQDSSEWELVSSDMDEN